MGLRRYQVVFHINLVHFQLKPLRVHDQRHIKTPKYLILPVHVSEHTVGIPASILGKQNVHFQLYLFSS